MFSTQNAGTGIGGFEFVLLERNGVNSRISAIPSEMNLGLYLLGTPILFEAHRSCNVIFGGIGAPKCGRP